MKYPIMLVTCAIYLALSNCKPLHADEFNVSFIAGLHVGHINHSTYATFNEEPVVVVEYTQKNKVMRDEYYNVRDLNDGFMQNDMIGLKLTYGQFALTGSTFKNSFYEPAKALAFTYDFIESRDWELSIGPVATYGYRESLVKQDHMASDEREVMFTAIVNTGYRLHENIQINYAILSGSASITTLEIMY